MTDLTKLTARVLVNKIDEHIVATVGALKLATEWKTEIYRRLERLEQIESTEQLAEDTYKEMRERLEKCEAALRKARMLLVNEGDPDEDGEMISEIDEFLGEAARVALEEK